MPMKRIQTNIQIYLFIKDPVFPMDSREWCNRCWAQLL